VVELNVSDWPLIPPTAAQCDVRCRGKKDKRGRPTFEPTAKHREQVEVLSGLFVQQATVAHLLDIDAKTLRKHFRAELDHGGERTVAKLKAIVFAAAKQGSLRACATVWAPHGRRSPERR
jgi:hypothetical protein